MEKSLRELLLKDLCARLPYGVMVDIKYSKENGSSDRLRICSEGSLTLNTDLLGLYIEDEIYLKSYLRPLSSMTEEEDKEWQLYKNNIACSCDENLNEKINELHDWFNEHRFDYRGLIKKGLALEAPEDMYKN